SSPYPPPPNVQSSSENLSHPGTACSGARSPCRHISCAKIKSRFSSWTSAGSAAQFALRTLLGSAGAAPTSASSTVNRIRL
ncbi:hypothetical protein PMAYCL1PPCAC_09159, partial [Pristionchus mayeri]